MPCEPDFGMAELVECLCREILQARPATMTIWAIVTLIPADDCAFCSEDVRKERYDNC
jgi:hypothetical protein